MNLEAVVVTEMHSSEDQMKPNEQMSTQFKRPESALVRSRREQATMAEFVGRMATELEREAQHGAVAPERKEFAERIVAILRRSEQWSRAMLA